MSTAIFFSIFLASVILHEIAHGAVAMMLGDTTAKDAGRLTLNPLKHIDLFWSILFPAFLFISSGGRFAFGMAKPVPVDFRMLHHPKRDMVWVALAGPATNFLQAVIFTLVFKRYGGDIWLQAVYLNLILFLLNLIPIPPLDGSRVVTGLLPRPAARIYLRLEKAGFIIVFLLYVSGALFAVIWPMLNVICRLLNIPGIS